MILNGFCFNCVASSRTTIGGLMTMTSPVVGATNFGGAGAAGLAGAELFGWPENLGLPEDDPRPPEPPRTLRISPRRLNSVREGSLALVGSDPPLVLPEGFCGSWMKPTLSPTWGPAGLGGAGGIFGASTAGAGVDSPFSVLVSTPADVRLGFRFGLGRRGGDEDDFFLDGRRLGRFRRGLGRQPGGDFGINP